MNKEELVKSLRDISRTNSVSLRKRDICAEAADVIERQSIVWHDAKREMPPDFVSVLGYMPSHAPFPTVHECYVAGGTWCCLVICDKGCDVEQWAEMPKREDG